jgi:hypothetical protein
MFDLEKSYGYDKVAADKGMKKPLGVDPEEYIQLRYIPGNKEYKALLMKKYRASSQILEFYKDKPDLAEEISSKIMAEVLAETVVTGWGKEFAVKGKAIPFSAENCVKVFLDYPAFRQDCLAWADDKANYPLVSDETTVEKVKK